MAVPWRPPLARSWRGAGNDVAWRSRSRDHRDLAEISRASVRAFIALPLPDHLRSRAADAADALLGGLADKGRTAALRRVPPDNMHITLRFLGEAEQTDLSGLSEHLTVIAAATPAFDYRLAGTIALPGPRRPKVLAAAVAPCRPLRELAGAVETAVTAEGFAGERRAFRAHVTLARVRARRPPRLPARLPAIEATGRAEEMVLYRSDPDAGGQVYTAVRRMPLGGDGRAPQTPVSG